MAYEHDQDDMIVHMPFLEEVASQVGIVVEIGCGHGNGSTRAFARGLDRSPARVRMHIGVDIDPERPQVKPAHFWHEVHGASEHVQTAMMVAEILEGRKADIIFIDTVHTYEQMEIELPVWAPLAKQETLWIFHDVWMFSVYNHMTEAIKEFARTDGWEYVDYNQASHGLGLLRKPGQWYGIEPLPRIVLVPQV